MNTAAKGWNSSKLLQPFKKKSLKSTTLIAASATSAAYAEQRERLGNTVDMISWPSGFQWQLYGEWHSAVTSVSTLATVKPKIVLGTGTDSNYNVPICYTIEESDKMTEQIWISLSTLFPSNPAASTLGNISMSPWIFIYNTGTQHKRCFLGKDLVLRQWRLILQIKMVTNCKSLKASLTPTN